MIVLLCVRAGLTQRSESLEAELAKARQENERLAQVDPWIFGPNAVNGNCPLSPEQLTNDFCTLTPDLSARREGYQRSLPLPNSATKSGKLLLQLIGTLGYPSQVLPVKAPCD